MNKLTIQAVSGAIRATKGITSSAKYSGAHSRHVRSTGAYAEVRRFSKDIVIGYWTNGSELSSKRAAEEMPKVIASLEERGYKVIRKQEPSWYGSSTTQEVLIVELAN